MEKNIYDLVNENANKKKMHTKPKRDYSRITMIATLGILGFMVVEVILYGYGLYLVTRI